MVQVLYVYRFPNSAVENSILLKQVIEDISKLKGELLIVRYFNYPTIDWRNFNTPHSTEHCATAFSTTYNDTHQKFTLILARQSIHNQLKLVWTTGKKHHIIINYSYMIRSMVNSDKIPYLLHRPNLNNKKNDHQHIHWTSTFDEKFVDIINPIISKRTPTLKNKIKYDYEWKSKNFEKNWKIFLTTATL